MSKQKKPHPPRHKAAGAKLPQLGARAGYLTGRPTAALVEGWVQGKSGRMRIAAVVGVMEEAGLIGPALAALRRAGVGRIAVLDDGSTDGTRERVAAVAAADPAITLAAPIWDDGPPFRLDGPVFGPLLRESAPDWLIITDADEFWLAAGGRIDRTPGLDQADVVRVERYNALPVDEAGLDDPATLLALNLILDRRKLDPDRMAAMPDRPWIMGRLAPKLMIRPGRVAGFSMAAHAAEPAPGAAPLRELSPEGLLIAHLPFTDMGRFARKIANVDRMLQALPEAPPLGKAWHWAHWLDLARRGELTAEFERQRLTPERQAALRASGGLRRAGDILAGLPVPGPA
jgi:hypothetical protein